MVILGLVAPYATFAFVAMDPRRRGIHDRLARVDVVQI
jgi:hypothetical protein